MTSQLLTNSLISVSGSNVEPLQMPQAQAQTVKAAVADEPRSRLIEAMKSQYQLEQQVELLYLQAEADSLLQQLQTLKKQREASSVR
ncbi:MAG: hypothetical protein RBJ76_21850 [Stenomitos frigidus ULC029]